MYASIVGLHYKDSTYPMSKAYKKIQSKQPLEIFTSNGSAYIHLFSDILYAQSVFKLIVYQYCYSFFRLCLLFLLISIDDIGEFEECSFLASALV
jgi:hypothetical protein